MQPKRNGKFGFLDTGQLRIDFLQNAIDEPVITGIICSMSKTVRKLLPIIAERLVLRLTLKGGSEVLNLLLN